MKLNELRDNEGATKTRVRVGRGIGSGKGKTSGRGVKGQKSRSGVAIKGFEGGQMPLYRRLPKFGFKNVGAKQFVVVNTGRIQKAIDEKKLDASGVIGTDQLKAAGLVSNPLDGVRILGQGELKAKISVQVAGISATARQAIEGAGGSVELIVPQKRVTQKNADKIGKRQQRRLDAAARRQAAKAQ